MSVKENKQLIRQLYQESGKFGGDVSKLRSFHEKYYAPDFINHTTSADMNREQVIQMSTMYITAFSETVSTINDTVAEGDKVVTRYEIKCTHTGMYMGIPATGKEIVVKGMEISIIKGDKVVETWDFPDSLGIMTQLGATLTTPKK